MSPCFENGAKNTKNILPLSHIIGIVAVASMLLRDQFANTTPSSSQCYITIACKVRFQKMDAHIKRVNHEFEFRKAAIKYSTDPHEIMRIFSTTPQTSYSHVLEEIVAVRMSILVRDDDTRNKAQGFAVIAVVLGMMRGNLGDSNTQRLGCDIFSRISEMYVAACGGMPPTVFSLNMDDIEHAVEKAVRAYQGTNVDWLQHADTVLQNISSIRGMTRAYSMNQLIPRRWW